MKSGCRTASLLNLHALSACLIEQAADSVRDIPLAASVEVPMLITLSFKHCSQQRDLSRDEHL